MPVKAMLAPIYNPARTTLGRVLRKPHPLERHLTIALAGMRIASGLCDIGHAMRLSDFRLFVNPHPQAFLPFDHLGYFAKMRRISCATHLAMAHSSSVAGILPYPTASSAPS